MIFSIARKVRRLAISTALFLAACAPAVAATIPIGNVAATPIGYITIAGTFTLSTTPTVVIDVRDLSNAANVTASSPFAGQLDTVSCAIYDRNYDGSTGMMIAGCTGIGNGQTVPIGYPPILFHLAPYGVIAVAGANLAGGGVIVEGQK